MLSRTQKITAVTGAAVLTLGLAGPAFANGSGSDSAKSSHQSAQHVAPTFAQVQSWIIKRIDKHLARIAKAEARVTASTVLTPQQKTDATARLAAKATALLSLKAQITAAVTKADLEAAIKAFALADGKLFWGARQGHGFHGFLGAWSDGDRDDPSPARTDAKAAAVRKLVKSTKPPIKAHPLVVSTRSRTATSVSLGDRVAVRTLSNGHRFMSQWSGQHFGDRAGHSSHGMQSHR